MNLSRRSFFTGLASSAAAALAIDFTKDPERALWIPGRKLFSIPGLRPKRQYRFPAQMLLTEQFYNSFRKPGLSAADIERAFYLNCVAPLEKSVHDQVADFAEREHVKPKFILQPGSSKEGVTAGLLSWESNSFHLRNLWGIDNYQHVLKGLPSVPESRLVISKSGRNNERILHVDVLVEA